MKLNPRRRRRRKKARRANPVRKASRRRKKKHTTSRRKKNPGRTRRRRARVRKNPGHGYKKNPGRRRRRRRRNPASTHALARRRKGGVRRRRGYRKNPGVLGMLGLDQIMNQNVWIFGGQALLGMSATAMATEWFARQSWVPYALKSRGGNVALSAFSTGLTFAGAKWLQRVLPKNSLTNNLPANMLAGGATYTLIYGLYAFFPRLFSRLRLPTPAGSYAASSDVAGLGRVYDGPYGRGGSYPGQYPGYGGMGSVESADALVAGESLSRQVSSFNGMGDWMELSGLAGSPVPIEDLRGMGDFIEMNPSAQLVQAGFDPGNESF